MAYSTFTWSELRERLKDRYEAVPFWTDEEALLAFNEALRFFNLLVGRWVTEVAVSAIPSQYDYTLPAGLLLSWPARIDYLTQPLSPTTKEDLNLGRYQWRTETTASGGDVPTRPMLWAPVSLRRFYLWPAVAAGVNDAIRVMGVADTPVLVEDGDAIDLGEETLNILLGYALHAAAFKKGGPFFQGTLGYLREFLIFAAEENSQLKTSKIYRRWLGQDNRAGKPLRGTPTLIDGLGAQG